MKGQNKLTRQERAHLKAMKIATVADLRVCVELGICQECLAIAKKLKEG